MRVVNFNPGPSALPLEVLEQIKQELIEYKGAGMSVMEMSHRGSEFMQILADAKKNIRELLRIPDGYEILFLQGGASQQFFMLPMNFLTKESSADYIETGEWSKKAIKEAKPFGNVNVVYSGASTNFKKIPKWSEMKFNKDSIYCHITTNNTIYGTQYRDMGNLEQGKLAADMSSDFMTRDFDINKFCFIYAGAQKHLGPSGVTVVIIRKDMAEKGAKNIPTILQYRTHIENDSLYNTPPAFAIYVVMLMTEWMKRLGGVAAIEKQVTGRAKKVYDILDRSQVYIPNVEKDSRSMTNITFRLKSEELEKKFADDAKKEGLVGLKGHRSAGGIRVSNYIAMTEQGIDKLVDFMKKFEKKS